jgi:phage portal protein BeeE
MQGLWGAADGDARRALMSSAVMTCIAALAATITAVPLARGWGRNTLI